MKMKLNKKCPRCKTKIAADLIICPNCQLNYNKFYEATNAEAKIAAREGNKDQILLREGYPSDVKKSTLVLLTIFLGFVGAHYYRVGRYKMGIFFSIFFLIGVTNAILSVVYNVTLTGSLGEIFYLLVLTWGAVLFIWIRDIYKVCFNKFKIPVSREG